MRIKLITLIFVLFVANIYGQFTTRWERTVRTGALDTKPTWFGTGTERGIAIGDLGNGKRLYVASRNGNKIRVINYTDGSDITPFPDFDLSSLSGGTFIMNDIGISDDNILFLGNMASTAFKLYLWNTEGGAPSNTYTFNLPSVSGIRYGDKFTVTGSWAAGTIKIYVPGAGTATTGAVQVLSTTDQGANWTITQISFSGSYKNSISSQHVAVLTDGSFYTSGNGSNPRKHDATGAYVTSSLFSGTNSSQAANKVFNIGRKTYLIQCAYRANSVGTGNKNTRIQLWEVTNPTIKNLIGETNLLSDNSVDFANSVNGDLEVFVDGSGKATLIVLGTDQGIAAFDINLSPTIDGTFDGNSYWGESIAISNNSEGWAGVNVGDLYSNYDDTYLYFGCKLNTVADWNSWGLVINTKLGGGSNEVWGYPITYSHANLPDFVIKGHFGQSSTPYAELRKWDGTQWIRINNDGIDAGLALGDFIGDDIYEMVEVRIKRTILDDPGLGDMQFYVSGDNQSEHAVFDSCPDDVVANSWNTSTTLSNYSNPSVPLPVELTSFQAIYTKNLVTLIWQTATEINSYCFEVERSNDNTTWVKIGSVNAGGNSNKVLNYEYFDNITTDGKYYYRLKQIDLDGSFKYTSVVEVNAVMPLLYSLSQNYPNPFNPTTKINYSIPENAKVTLNIYSITGELVTTLVDEDLAAGNYNIDFDASKLASGTYFYRIIANDFIQTKKMLLIK